MVAPRAQEPFDVWHEVPMVPQLTGMSCWAAAAAMIVGWRDCLDVRPEEVAAGLGRWDAYRAGLEPDDVDDLARVFDLTIEPPRTYSVGELRRLLETAGPLWLGESVPGLHVVVAAGLYGDGSPDGSWVRIADPWPIGRGERYRISFRELSANLAQASSVVGATAQVLHSAGQRLGRGARPPHRGARAEDAAWYRGLGSLAPGSLAPGSLAPGSIVIDPGHGGSAAIGGSSPLGVRGPAGTLEKDVTLALARRVAGRLGRAAVLTRARDVNLPLAERMAVARRAAARVFVSIHANGGASPGRGAEAYVHRRAGDPSHHLAAALQAELVGPTAPAPAGEDMAVLTPEQHAPITAACLLEVDYLSDPDGERRLRDPARLDQLADRIARAIRGRAAAPIRAR